MSIEALEQKKILLPYLDKIEYINCQLKYSLSCSDSVIAYIGLTCGMFVCYDETRMRGLLPEGEAVEEHRQDAALSQQPATPEKSNSTGVSASSKPSTKRPPAVVNQAMIGRNQERTDEPVDNASVKLRLSTDLLRARYPRLFETIGDAARLSPRARPITWLMKLVEDIYDALSDALPLAPKSNASMDADTSPRPESAATEKPVLSPARTLLIAKSRNASGKLALPSFARRFIHHTLGLPTLADQDCLDLIYNIEITRERFPDIALFSNFLRELFDGDALTFFLAVRCVAQEELDLQLSSKEKQARTSSAKRYIPGNLFEVSHHPLIPDGTKQVHLSADGCDSVLRRLFTYSMELRPSVTSSIPTPIALAKYVVKEKMVELFSASGKSLIPIEEFFSYMVQAFRDISEDIVAQFKYNDDGRWMRSWRQIFFTDLVKMESFCGSLGESLTSLIRLRDTISCDSKIDKMVIAYGEQERALRNMKIELMKMERSNSDNRFRTQICLMQNRIRLQGQELQNVQSEINSTESRVNDVWREVVQPQAKGTRLRTSSTWKSTKNASATELASILGRFECFVARLQKKHEIEVKASMLLAKPWKEQMEELKLRMVVRIQRAYRARGKARDTKEQAKAKLRDQIRERDIKLRNEQIDRKRLQALHEKDMQRHHARLQAKRMHEEQVQAELEAKQKDLIKKLREEEISQRNSKRNRQHQEYTFKKWNRFVQRRCKKRQATRLFLKFKLLKWKVYFSAYKRREEAAKRIQQFVRSQQERERLRRVLNVRMKRNKIARKYLQKVQMRRVNLMFNQWCRFTVYHQNLKANFQSVLRKRADNWFQQWVEYIAHWKAKRIAAAAFIQRVYRGRIARQVFRFQRTRNHSALTIQRVYRGYRCRVEVALLKKLRRHQDSHCRMLLRRIQDREVYSCFSMLKLYAFRSHTIKRMACARQIACQLRAFHEWSDFVHRRREKRAAFLRKQYESAIRIQRNYRRHRCQIVFRESIKLHRAATAIQRVVRGFQGRERAKRCRWERNAAISLQTAWRKRRAKRLAESARAEKILLGAFKGDYSSTKRAIMAGYWYVMDQEGNGIVHMASVAGHKRLVKLCLRSRLDINVVNRHGQTPLYLLLANLSHPTSVDELIQERMDKVALAAYMIDHGAWHEAPDEDGLTPLLLCAALGQTEAVDMLLEREANTDARSMSGGLNAAQLAVEGNHSATLRALLDSRGFDSDQNGRDTVRLLHACAGRGLIDCMRALVAHIQQRADSFPESVLDTLDGEGYTPLIYAISNGFVDIVQCLLESNAGPDVNDLFRRSPLHFAVCCGHPLQSEAMVKLLTMYEADVNGKDNDGDAPLHLSCDRDDRLACTSLLLKHGAVICSNALGNHPTHIAARHGAVATLKLLVQYGGDMNLKNYEGRTPLGMARMYDQKAVVQYITCYFAQEALVSEAFNSDAAAEPEQIAHGAAGVALGQETDLLEEQASERGDEETSFRPAEMSSSEWEDALASGYWMGAIAEWTQYIDTKRDVPFYCCQITKDAAEEAPVCTWDPPVEFEASLGEEWEITRATIASSSSRSSSSGNLGESRRESTRASVTKPAIQYLYHNKVTGEFRAEVPPMNYLLLQDVVQNSRRQKMLRARVHKVSAADTSASAMEYLRFVQAFERESAQTRMEIHASIKIQRHFRARRTTRLVKSLLHENRNALNLQRAFRGRKARRAAAFKRKEHADATRIQSLWRGYTTRKQEALGLRAQRMALLRRRMAALQIQRVFRGWSGRKGIYREKVVRTLGPKGYFAWEQLRQRAVVVRSFKVWDEMNAKQDFPGVLFYCHQVTRACNWEKPEEWVAADRAAFEERRQLYRWGYTQQMKLAAVQLQRLWRARLARISFQMIMRSVRLMQTCEQEYLEEPTNLVKMGNYVLYLHTITHDYERARPLYGRLMRMMAQRGPDLSFILLSYGIFLYVTQEEDSGLVEEMIVRGKLKDPRLLKYKMAFLGFFRQALVQNPLDAESNLNYAASLHWLYGRYDEATEYYLRAIAANPHKQGSMELFQEMLNRKRQVDKMKVKEQERDGSTMATTGAGKKRQQPMKEEEEEFRAQYDGFEVFRRWQLKQAEEDDRQRRRALEAEQEAKDRMVAARKIQARYRRRAAMRQVNRVKREKQLATSIAELAKQKGVYDKVVLAFDQLALVSSSLSGTSPAAAEVSAATKLPSKRPLSVPIAQLNALFRGMKIGLSELEVQEATAQFQLAHPKLRHVNVMDLCHFTEGDAALTAKVAQASAAAK